MRYMGLYMNKLSKSFIKLSSLYIQNLYIINYLLFFQNPLQTLCYTFISFYKSFIMFSKTFTNYFYAFKSFTNPLLCFQKLLQTFYYTFRIMKITCMQCVI